MIMKLMKACAIAVMVFAAAAPARPAHAETELRAITSFSANQIFAKEFARFLETMNSAAPGVVKVRLIGGPEAMPPPQQAAGLKAGIVDMMYSPASFYRGQM